LVGSENEGENAIAPGLGLNSVVGGALGGVEQEERQIEYGKSFSGKKFNNQLMWESRIPT
jgi:hypothetical protein